ncbi:MAG: Z1 domain-containing protein [Paludibacteraceae bacterium]|nr:Z1 domain-containing protein [Paludibacteraceae bacterium]
MTQAELEEAKKTLRKTLESQKSAISITKEDLAMFVEFQFRFFKKWTPTAADKQELISYLENYIFVKHDHDGYAIISDEPFDSHWYTNNKPKNEYFWDLFSEYHAEKGDLDRASLNLLGNKTLPDLMNCLGDPKERLTKQRKRYGLVLGDVQSGKTSTYSGLICKAADAGVKVVILLAGITETLRQQTQERIEEDIVGLTIRTDNFHNNKPTNVGVGTLKGWENKVTTYTLYEDDFNMARAKTMSSIGTHKSIVLFVVKKNVPVLTHLHEWLTGPNQQLNKEGKLPYSLLLIDDEADNASINTKDSTLDPTATNRKIREICEVFMNSNYVGFTATPYANIFINPETDEDMTTADLFPKDFIYVLPTPEPYIGAQRIFGKQSEEHPRYGNCSYMIDKTFITDIKEPTKMDIREMTEEQLIYGPIYYKHKKDWRGKLSKSLIEAIRCYYISNAIRDLDDAQFDAPRTMLVNISKYINVHSYLKRVIAELVEADYKEIRVNFSKNQERNIGNPLYDELHRLFEKHYTNCGYTWKQVGQREAFLKWDAEREIKAIHVIVVNGSKESREDTPNYKKNPSLRIIAVGGLALSRGLTLKGLMTSYFYRNTCTYDVLMQMGRWFGYRPHYDKVCRIWITNTSANWYREIAEATDELKSELAHMNSLELTPEQFGLRIRRDDTALEITARNKMRKAGKCEVRTTFWGDVFETPYFSANILDNTINVEETKNWLQTIVQNGAKIEKVKSRASFIMRNIALDDITDILGHIHTSDKNLKFDRARITRFLVSNKEELATWDVAIVGGTGDYISGLLPDSNLAIKASLRSLTIRGDGEAFAFTQQGVVSGNNDGTIGLPNPKEVQEDFQIKEAQSNPLSAQKINRCTWFKYAKRTPVLFIYPVLPSNKDGVEPVLKDYLDELGQNPIMGYSIGIPGFGHESDTRSYYANVVYQNNDGLLDSDEDE